MAEYAYLVTLCCVLAVIAGSALYTHQVREAAQESGVEAAAPAPEVRETASPTILPQVTPLPTIAPLEARVLVMRQETIWPVEGAVLREHDLLTAVYWQALGAWQTHSGVDIAASAGQAVRAAANGVVKSTARDELWGWQVVVDQDDGRTVRYCGLETCMVSAGESVRREQTIGNLLERIPCEGEMAAHLHLEVTRDGAAQDPIAMLPEVRATPEPQHDAYR